MSHMYKLLMLIQKLICRGQNLGCASGILQSILLANASSFQVLSQKDPDQFDLNSDVFKSAQASRFEGICIKNANGQQIKVDVEQSDQTELLADIMQNANPQRLVELKLRFKLSIDYIAPVCLPY
jgi:hypothetical protein